MIVIDSSVWISHFANVLHPEVQLLRSIRATEELLLGELILLEVLRGAQSRYSKFILDELSVFESETMADRETILAASENYRRLRALGITPRNTVDLIIGTYCIEHGHHLLHRDRDFDHMTQLGLRTYAG